MPYLTTNFTEEELIRSPYAVRHGLDNTPPADVLANLYLLADGLERVRTILSVPLYVDSGYRSPKVNAGVGGARTNQHLQGLAADIVPLNGMSISDAAHKIIDHEDFVAFDQLIHEGTWMHVSFNWTKGRGDILTAHFGPAGVSYSRGIA
jgi:hypothetical protein